MLKKDEVSYVEYGEGKVDSSLKVATYIDF